MNFIDCLIIAGILIAIVNDIRESIENNKIRTIAREALEQYQKEKKL